MDRRSMIPSNKEWQLWGATDPLYGVASWEGKAKGGAAPWTPAEFYRLGEQDWTDFEKRWSRYGLVRKRCVEIGCGAGRITARLAKTFEHVHAIDVSEAMLDVARQHVTGPVTYHLSSGTELPLADESVSAAFSCHVFQHFDSIRIGEQYFAELARVLEPGGTLMIHLPIYDYPMRSRIIERLYVARRLVEDVKSHITRRLMERGLHAPIMRHTRYPIDFFYERLPQLGLGDIEINVFATTSNNTPHPFVLARKLTAK